MKQGIGAGELLVIAVALSIIMAPVVAMIVARWRYRMDRRKMPPKRHDGERLSDHPDVMYDYHLSPEDGDAPH